MAQIRTFIAVPLPASLQQACASLMQQFRRCDAPVKWVDWKQLHVTMRFLGDVRDTDLARLCRDTADVASRWEPFEAQFAGVGAFPDPGRPRTIWVGIHAADDSWQRLHADLEEATDWLGIPRERRRFHPHVTIGRVREARGASVQLPQMLKQQADADFGSFVVDQVVVFSSDLTPSGPIYTVVGSAEFYGDSR